MGSACRAARHSCCAECCLPWWRATGSSELGERARWCCATLTWGMLRPGATMWIACRGSIWISSPGLLLGRYESLHLLRQSCLQAKQTVCKCPLVVLPCKRDSGLTALQKRLAVTNSMLASSQRTLFSDSPYTTISGWGTARLEAEIETFFEKLPQPTLFLIDEVCSQGFSCAHHYLRHTSPIPGLVWCCSFKHGFWA